MGNADSVFSEKILELESPAIRNLIQLENGRRNVMGFLDLGSYRELPVSREHFR